jgi:hypothetical protein
VACGKFCQCDLLFVYVEMTNLVTEVGVDADELTAVDSGDTLHVDGSLALGVTLAVTA